MSEQGLTPEDLAAIDGRIKDVYTLKVSVEEYIKRRGEDNWRIALQWARKEQDKHDDLMRLRAEVTRCHAVMAENAVALTEAQETIAERINDYKVSEQWRRDLADTVTRQTQRIAEYERDRGHALARSHGV